MKKNVQLYTAKQAYDEIFHYKPKGGKIDKVRFDEDGYLHWTEGGKQMEMNPFEVMSNFNMPLYEVCMVDNLGDDEYAIILFEC